MTNTITDHTSPLRTDFIHREKAQYDIPRRRYNKGNADDFEFKLIPARLQTHEEYAIAANVDDKCALINSVTASETLEQPHVYTPDGNIF